MSWLNFSEVLSYLICFSGTETEDENDVEEEGESVSSEQLNDAGTKDLPGTTAISIGVENGKCLSLIVFFIANIKLEN